MKIEILGSGCSKCKQLEANARKALQELKKEAPGKIKEVMI